MKTFVLLLLGCVVFTGFAYAGPRVEMKTSLGTIQIELNAEKAPETVRNFLKYVDQKYYDGTIFHRVIEGFMIQGGGFDVNEKRKSTLTPIKNEADNGLKNIKGSVAMARTGVVDSATSQFFINLVDNDFLNHRGRSAKKFGYAVFGQVTGGMDVVEKIGRIKTISKSPVFRNIPETAVIVEAVRRMD